MLFTKLEINIGCTTAQCIVKNKSMTGLIIITWRLGRKSEWNRDDYLIGN
jgi:hypothetical protein